jgi:hypothetical protein
MWSRITVLGKMSRRDLVIAASALLSALQPLVPPHSSRLAIPTWTDLVITFKHY